jgi:uncharacterized protein (TIGR02246 family)
MKPIVTAAFALFLLGCTVDPNEKKVVSAIDIAKEEAAIRATDAAWAVAVKARDAERAASFWSDDASIIMPGAPPVEGKDAIKKFVSDALNMPDFTITWETVKIEVAASGDLAYQTARDTVTHRGPKNKLVTEHNRAIVIWKKQVDGTWKAKLDMWTPAAPNAAH